MSKEEKNVAGTETKLDGEEVNTGCVVTAEEVARKDNDKDHGIIVFRLDSKDDGVAINTSISATTNHMIAAYEALGRQVYQKTCGLYGSTGAERNDAPDMGSLFAQMFGGAEA